MEKPTGILTPRTYSERSEDAALDYIEGVLERRIVTGELVRLACLRHVNDLRAAQKNSARWQFDIERARRVFRFFAYLRHWKGEWGGEQLVLSPWQAFVLWSLFGWVRADGARRFRQAYIQVGRKNGKTTISAGVGLYLFAADGEPGAEVYTAATKRDQARIAHADAIQMRHRSPELRARIKCHKDNLSVDASASKFEPLGANSETQDGLNVSGAVIDELHRHKTRDLWDVIEYGTGARRQPLMLGITTAGDNADSMCFEMREHAEKVLRGVIEYETLFAFIAEPDKDDDYADERTWAKGNPNLGISVKLDKLREDFEKARQIPSALASFRRYRLDQWITGGADSWMDMEAWNACPAVRLAVDGRTCYGGLDLASTQDIAAFVLYFPPEGDDLAHVLAWFFIPRENIAERAKSYRIPLESWVKDGWVIATPGNVIDYGVIRETILEASGIYRIEEIGYDDWNSTQLVTELVECGLSLVPLQQTVKTFNAPMHRIEDLVVERRLRHGHNPVLRWMASNVHCASDPAGRIRPLKKDGKRRFKIDGIVGLGMGVSLAMAHEQGDSNVINLPEDYTVPTA